MKRESLFKMSGIALMAALIAYMFYIQVPCYADDAGTYVRMYHIFELGDTHVSLSYVLDPWFFCSAFAYIFNIGGSGIGSSLVYLAFFYGICAFLTLLFITYKRKNSWMVFLGFFILIPGVAANKYHLVPTISVLAFFGLMQCYKSTKNKLFCYLGVLQAIYIFVFTSDRVIMILFLGGTLSVYYGILIFQDKKRRKYLYWLALAMVAGAVSVKIIDIIAESMGKDIGITKAFSGYGGSNSLEWIDVQNFFSKGIPSFFSGLVSQWNIPLEGGIMQYNSFYWMIRLALVVIVVIALFCRWKQILQQGMNSIELLDALSTICVTVVSIVNIINGKVKYYEIDWVYSAINRYNSISWFLLVVIVVRWLDEQYINKSLTKKITTNSVLAVTMVLLCIGYMAPIYKSRGEVVKENYSAMLDYIVTHKEVCENGLASYWKSFTITAATNGEHIVEGVKTVDNKIRDYHGGWSGSYNDGSYYYNYIILDIENPAIISMEDIEAIRGDYVDVYSNGDTIYLYDYDIRWDPKLVMQCVETDYELVDPIEYQFDFPVGTNRIEMTVSNSENFDLEIVDSPDIENVEIRKVDENKIQVDIVCLQNTNVIFKVARKTDELTTIHKIVLKRVKGAITVYEAGQKNMSEVYLNSGSYVFTFTGKNIDDLEVFWSGDNIETKQLTDGKIRRRYRVEIKEPQTIQYTFAGDGVTVDKISYENAVLFEDK